MHRIVAVYMGNDVILESRTRSIGIRQSGVDLLRIIAVLLICLFHANQTACGLVDVDSLEFFIKGASFFLSQLGQIGNMLFVICSAFFLCDSRRSRSEKALGILLDSTVISVFVLIGFLIGGYSFNLSEVFMHIFPDIFGNVWFVPCYVLYYFFAPIIGMGLKKLGRKVHLAYCLCVLIVYCGLALFYRAPFGNELIAFFLLFGLVAYEKWYMPKAFATVKWNLILFFVGFLVAYGLYFAYKAAAPVLGWRDDYFSPNIWCNPFRCVALICLFNLFVMMKFRNKFVSYLASCSLFVYCIHENKLLRSITRVAFYNAVFERFGQSQYVLWSTACGLFMFVVGFLIAAVYRESFHRLTALLANRICSLLRKLYNRFYCWFYSDSPVV